MIAHNIRYDGTDDLQGELGDLWALTGARGTASTVVIAKAGTYDIKTGAAMEWSNTQDWTQIEDITAAGTFAAVKGKLKEKKEKGSHSALRQVKRERKSRQQRCKNTSACSWPRRATRRKSSQSKQTRTKIQLRSSESRSRFRPYCLFPVSSLPHLREPTLRTQANYASR
jgi:hypothetical protein